MVAAIQLPLASPSAAPLPLDPKLFRPGTTLEALVLGKTAEGLTQLQIADLLVLARLPQAPPPGTVLQLAVKSGGPVPELVVMSQQAPSAVSPAVVQVPQPASPATTTMPVALPQAEIAVMAQMPSAAVTGAPAQALNTSVPRPELASILPSGSQPLGQPAGGQMGPAPSVGPPGSIAPSATALLSGSPVAARSTTAVPSASISSVAALAPAPQTIAAVPVPAALPNSALPGARTVMIAAEAVTLPTQPSSSSPTPPAVQLSLRPGAVLPASLPQAPAPAQTPQAALVQMVPAALAQQGSPAPLLQALTAAVASAIPLPMPVLRAAQQVLANRIPVTGLAGEALKAAVERSGVVMEAVLRAGSPPPATDGKAGLLALRSALVSWLGDLAPVDPVRRVAPPIKGETLRAQLTDPAPELPSTPHEIGRALHGHTEAALSRLKLMQLASLPDADGNRPSGPELRLELPLLVGSELAMAQLQIFRDGKRERDAAKRGWTMRFAVATQATGEIGAEVGLIGKTVSVALWAAEEEIAAALSGAFPELSEGLTALGLASSIRLRPGPPQGSGSVPGSFVDRGS